MTITTSQNLRILAALLSGVLVAFGFPGEGFPFLSWASIQPLAFVPLFLALDTLPKASSSHTVTILSQRRPMTAARRFRTAFLLTWLSGITTVSIAFYWSTYPAILFGGIPPSAAYPAFAVYAILSGSFFPVLLSPYLLLVLQEGRRQGGTLPLVALALLSTAIEVWTPRFFFWSLGSLMHDSLEASQLASVFGFNGLTFLILLSNSYIARAVLERAVNPLQSVARLGTVALIWVSVLGWGHWRISKLSHHFAEEARKSHVGLIQPNYTFDELSSNPTRSQSAQQMSLEHLHHLSEKLMENVDEKLDLLIWPESVAPPRFALSETQQKRTKELSRRHNTPILVQATEFDPEEVQEFGFRRATIYSSSFLLRPDLSRSSSYRKWIPIPFGETVPMEEFFPEFADFLRENVGNLSKVGRGSSYEALPYSPRDYVAPLICFDAIEPELPRLQTKYGRASLLVNQSNFVWMGRSNAGFEFKELVRMRAIENARSAVLAANTGPSVIFDPLGRELTETTELLKPEALSAFVPISEVTTPFTIWGFWPIHVGGVVSAFALIWAIGRRHPKKQSFMRSPH